MLTNTTSRRNPGESVTHLVFPDTFSLFHVSKSASVILETLTKLGALQWEARLPWILRCARSSLYISGTFLSPSSAASLSRARITQVTVGFTSSVWPCLLSVWFQAPTSSEKIRFKEGKQTECQAWKFRGWGQNETIEAPFPFSKNMETIGALITFIYITLLTL